MTPPSSSGYPMITYTHPVASNFPIKKTLVAGQLSINTHSNYTHTRTTTLNTTRIFNTMTMGSQVLSGFQGRMIFNCFGQTGIQWLSLVLRKDIPIHLVKSSVPREKLTVVYTPNDICQSMGRGPTTAITTSQTTM